MNRRAAVAASLAALAESGLLFLPIRALVVEESGASEGPLVTYPAFVALFTLSVALAAAWRHSATMPSVAAGLAIAVGLGQTALGGGAGLATFAFLEILSLLVALRVVVLAHRDWRDPVAGSFALGAVVLLVEVLLGTTGGETGWEPYLPVVVALFFVGSLGARAASVWLAHGRSEGSDLGARRRARTALVTLGTLGAVLVLAATLGEPDAILPRAGSVLLFLMGQVFYGIAFVLARVVAGPIAWVVERLGIDLDFASRAAQALEDVIVRGTPRPQPGTSPLLRVLGLLTLVAIGLLLFRAIRRYRELAGASRGRPGSPQPEPRTARPGPRRRVLPSLPRLRRELPDDVVRRWYAEALLALESLGLPKAPSVTPGEYLHLVTGAFPACAPGFTALTRAYEDVRYGSRVMARSSLDSLEANRQMAMDALRRATKLAEETAYRVAEKEER